ncbi:ubiquinol-cytochrome c reductase cytochrome b subunit [Planosporangium flavigriseum]|uniref:Cytochrome bc1 complex cytochrome b subunit n=1 Tax=Planosporangium flavigriseum TaxID=373681 RepID=A0A8J3PK87_9ACTN|nr:ubiquinol-cytochrome c reductase cytochrome b subunit [Planosporangium flavigriseum]NJC63297.1 ubiquinol-cytochrome c reductase cytochrome b subunit [Planosporangium flavigriseum]GIG72572.1 cytochrome bc1 complex cytochrome b subunit [Planosporangium flavigriseum]
MKRRKFDVAALPAKAGGEIDDRLQVSAPLRRLFNKVFPDHWSFLLGEIALYSFIVLLLTGTFLTLWFDPSMEEVHYNGPYTPLNGIEMSRAYESSLQLSFEVRGGLIMRQMHHWAALLFMASIVVHMLRVFFTGAFRKPRELNWVIGVLLFWLGFVEGFAGYSLPDDALSGTGLRIAHAIMLSIPVVGTWVATSLFGGEFPGTVILGRLYIAHVLLVPAILLGLIAAHMGLLVKQKHTQWPGPGRSNDNVVGVRMFPGFAAKGGAFFMVVFGVIALLGGLFQINPVWLFGPYKAAVVSAASQPDWYVMFLDGSTRLMPPWEARFPLWPGHHYTLPPLFWPTVFLPGVLTMLPLFYPFIEARKFKSKQSHHLLQRPRDVPTRTSLGAMALAFYFVLMISGANDVLAEKFHISLNAMTWAGRIGLLLLPPLAYWVTYRICLGLQQHDREVLAHGMETGIIKRLPNGAFVEVHQPLSPVDAHGHPTELPYAGWVVPKKMNRIGALVPTVKGFFFPVEEAAQRTLPAEAPVSPAPSREGIGSGKH